MPKLSPVSYRQLKRVFEAQVLVYQLGKRAGTVIELQKYVRG